LIDRQRPFGTRLEIDDHPSGVDAAALTDVVRQPCDVWILADDVRDLRLVADHVIEPDTLNRLGADEEPALVLAGKKTLGDSEEQVQPWRSAGFAIAARAA
jgi:hypothetical protein